MLRGLHVPAAQGVVGRLVEQPQQEPGGEQPHAGLLHVLPVQQALVYRVQNFLVGAAAVYVAAVLQGQLHRLLRPGGDLVVAVEIRHSPAVRDEMPPEAPLLPQDFLQRGAAAAGLPVGAVVGAHHGLHPGFLHAGLKGGEVGLLHVLLAGFGVEAVAQRLGAGVHGKVFCAGGPQQVLPVALQALDKAHPQPGGELRVLAVGLLAPAPAGVTEDVYIGGPEGEPLVDVPVPTGGGLVVFGPALDADGPAHLLHGGGVEGGGHADGLGEHGGHPGPGHPVEGLVPPVVGWHPPAGGWQGRRTAAGRPAPPASFG